MDGMAAVVTGGGRGIGRGICRRFAQEGADLIVAEIDDADGEAVAEQCREFGARARFVHTDVTQKDQVLAMIDAAIEEYGRLDVLVNNAISLSPNMPLEHKTDEHLEFSFRVGAYATWWAMHAAFPHMKAQGGGRIVNFYSADADYGMWCHADYNMTKAAIGALTRSAAQEWGRFGIRANLISPNAMGTVFFQLQKEFPERFTAPATNPLGRRGDPETDIAPVAVFLATDDSAYYTGETMYVTGGGRLIPGNALKPEDLSRWD
jgi:NAD(P)-dependent dehydrogenase (short-subunit alcohol dehydrogenase family)